MILFDLDGTLVDTAHDLGYALNLQREKHGLPALTHETIRPYASHGSKGLLLVGFGLSTDDPTFADMRDEYLALYDAVLVRKPVLFEGVPDLLNRLDERLIPWGVVTNKPRRFTQPLLENIGLLDRAKSVVCADDVARPKPYPDSLYLACQHAGIPPELCWYVGDAQRDIEAGRAAGMRTVVAMYGYLGDEDEPQTWGADSAIDKPTDLLGLI
ncbi:MAG: HAD-IA family hydrolase [Methylotenera sp.]